MKKFLNIFTLTSSLASVFFLVMWLSTSCHSTSKGDKTPLEEKVFNLSTDAQMILKSAQLVQHDPNDSVSMRAQIEICEMVACMSEINLELLQSLHPEHSSPKDKEIEELETCRDFVQNKITSMKAHGAEADKLASGENKARVSLVLKKVDIWAENVNALFEELD